MVWEAKVVLRVGDTGSNALSITYYLDDLEKVS